MYRIFPKKFVFISTAWIAIGVYVLFELLGGVIYSGLRISAVPATAWMLTYLLLLNPVWRFFWKKFPSLNRLIFPDLNGKWRVELHSNWPRQLQLLEAAQSKTKSIDMRGCDEAELAKLVPMLLEAEISQSWWSFEMKLRNPKGDTPIKKSLSITIDPFRGDSLHNHGICYIYKQENDTDNVSDDNEFYGAARLEYDLEQDQLEGLVWTSRMWKRAMNTASKAVFTRIP